MQAAACWYTCALSLISPASWSQIQREREERRRDRAREQRQEWEQQQEDDNKKRQQRANDRETEDEKQREEARGKDDQENARGQRQQRANGRSENDKQRRQRRKPPKENGSESKAQMPESPRRAARRGSDISFAEVRREVHTQIRKIVAIVDPGERKRRLNELRLRWHPDKNTLLQSLSVEVSKLINAELDGHNL